MQTITKFGILGCCGRMGVQILNYLHSTNKASIGGAYNRDSKNNPYINQDVSQLLQQNSLANKDGGVGILPKLNVKITCHVEDVFATCDVLIDFTSPQASVAHAKLAAQHGKPLFIGTTGFTEQDYLILKECSRHTAIMQANNTSFGLNVVRELVRLASSLLPSDAYDFSLTDVHHKHKKDAPSGTVKTLWQDHCTATEKFKNNSFQNSDSTNLSPQICSIRGGEVIGTHTISYWGEDESIQITHTAFNRNLFAKGAVEAASWLAKQTPGWYDILKQSNNFK